MKNILLLAATLLPLWAQVTITPKGTEKITIDIDGKPFTDFWIGPETKKPYLHPLRTASARGTTSDGLTRRAKASA